MQLDRTVSSTPPSLRPEVLGHGSVRQITPLTSKTNLASYLAATSTVSEALEQALCLTLSTMQQYPLQDWVLGPRPPAIQSVSPMSPAWRPMVTFTALGGSEPRYTMHLFPLQGLARGLRPQAIPLASALNHVQPRQVSCTA